MTQSGFSGKTAIVTGASQGIGAVVATAFAQAGANVVVHYRSSEDSADKVVTDISERGCNAIAVNAALNQPDDVDRPLVPKPRVNLTRLDEGHPCPSPYRQPSVVQIHSR